MLWNATSTFVESNADVSMNERPFFSEKVSRKTVPVETAPLSGHPWVSTSGRSIEVGHSTEVHRKSA